MKNDHRITAHEGILEVVPEASGERVTIAFDPDKLADEEVRKIAEQHFSPELEMGPHGMRRWVMRLDGRACEAAAGKLERRIHQVHGVRQAKATFVGHVLCLTFDSAVSDSASVLRGVTAAGAKVKPLEARTPAVSFWQALRVGKLNSEISCGLGLALLIVGAVLERTLGMGPTTWTAYGLSYFFGGQQGVRAAIASLREKTLDVDLLMVLAAIGAALVGAPFEGALLLFLFSFSNVLQSHAMNRTQRAIESLLQLRPETALRKRDGLTESVAIERLLPGDIVVVRPGELLPVDGEIAEGQSTLDESSLTGESMPVDRAMGDRVFAGTLNHTGGLEIRVTKAAGDSVLAKMVRLVAEAQAEKSQTQRFLEKAEQRYAAGVILFTALVFIVPWMLWDHPAGVAFYRAMTVMVVASPCALIISTPATVLSAIGGAARRGLLIKGGSHLEMAARVDIVCFDKTGTLTRGKPVLTEILSRDQSSALGEEPLHGEALELLAIAAALESRSEHPLADAIVHAVTQHSGEILSAVAFQSITGKGAEAEVRGKRYVIGSERFLTEQDAQGMPWFRERVRTLEQDGKTCVWLGKRVAGEVVEMIGVFALADTLREHASEVVGRLHQAGVRRVVMLTGDHESVAHAIAQRAGIDEYRAGLLPEDKVQVIRRLKEEGVVLMVGDGVNDAPALATAHLGIAMGAAGTDIAMETADVVLMSDRLEQIVSLLDIARHAKRVLTQNLVFASTVIAVLVAAALGFSLALPIGVIGHEGSTVLVCLNGLRLLGYRPK